MPGHDLLAFTDQLGLATSAAPAAPADRELHLVLFRLGREEYGVPITLVREIVRVQDVTRVPHAPAQIRGVMNGVAPHPVGHREEAQFEVADEPVLVQGMSSSRYRRTVHVHEC